MATAVSKRYYILLQYVIAVTFFSWMVHCGEEKIPDYIDICKRNDPNVDKCVMKSIEDLKPRLIQGIPEMKIPPLDPLIIPMLPLFVEGISHDSYCSDIKVHGLGGFKITHVKVDLVNRDFALVIEIPEIYLEGHLELKVEKLTLKGSGPFKANSTGIKVTSLLFDQLVERDGKQYMNFTECRVQVDIENLNMQIGDIFHGKKMLANLTNDFVKQNPHQMIHAILPSMEKLVSEMVLESANDLTSKFSYDEIFPPS